MIHRSLRRVRASSGDGPGTQEPEAMPPTAPPQRIANGDMNRILNVTACGYVLCAGGRARASPGNVAVRGELLF
jgi:hypothetical protein